MRVLVLLGVLLLPLPLLAAGLETTEEENARNVSFQAGKKAIEAKNWQAAAEAFGTVVRRDPWNADAHNFLGYAYRHLGQMPQSFKHYNEALKLSPRHRGAHEYIGWAYLKTGQVDKAREHLAQLEAICGKDCEEYRDLAAGFDMPAQGKN